jgi:hypothetical protein
MHSAPGDPPGGCRSSEDLAALFAAAVGCSEEAPAPCPLEAAKPGVPAQIVADDELFLVRFTDGRVACFGVDTSGACALGGGGIIAAPLFSEALTCMDQIDLSQIGAGRRASGEVLLWGYYAEDLARLNDVDVGRLWPPLPVKSVHAGPLSVVYVLPSGGAAWHGTHTVLVEEDWDFTDVDARVPTEIPLPSAVVDVTTYVTVQVRTWAGRLDAQGEGRVASWT